MSKVYVKGLAEGITDVQFTDTGITEIEMGKSFFREETAQELFPNSYSGIQSVTLLGTGTDPSLGNVIAADAFKGCTGLQTFYVESLVAWTNCELGNEYSNPCYYTKNIIVTGTSTSITSVAASDFVTNATAARACSFINCLSLTSVTLPNSITAICSKAFSGCSSIETFSSGSQISTIAGDAFENVPVTAYAHTETIDGHSLYMFHGYVVEVPLGIETIDLSNTKGMLAGVFNQYATLTSVTLGALWQEIPENAFCECTALAGVTIPSGISRIGEKAFYYCDNMGNLIFMGGGIRIGANAFTRSPTAPSNKPITYFQTFADYLSIQTQDEVFKYTNLRIAGGSPPADIEIPSSVKEVSAYAFSGWAEITSITLLGEDVHFGKEAFSFSAYRGVHIKIPSFDAWFSYTYDTGTSSPACASSDYNVLYIDETMQETITIPTNIQKIKDFACFHLWIRGDCTIDIPDNIIEIGESAFAFKVAIPHRNDVTITIGKNVSAIGDNAFSLYGYCPYVIKFRGNCPQTLGENIFSETLTAPIHVPSNSTGWERLIALYPNAEIVYDQPPIS